MITVTFYAPTKLSRRIQDNVKMTGGRFVCNPFTLFNNDQSSFTISFEGDANYNKFSACTQIIQQPWFN